MPLCEGKWFRFSKSPTPGLPPTLTLQLRIIASTRERAPRGANIGARESNSVRAALPSRQGVNAMPYLLQDRELETKGTASINLAFVGDTCFT